MQAAPIQLAVPLKFLVVDDSRAIQAIVRRAISNCGYQPIEVQTAMDGEQALDIIESFAPNLVITDWHMPKVSGLEMVQALRQMGHHHIRVGFVTTEKTPALLEEAKSNGALFILHKPFNDQELVAVVAEAVKDLIKVAAAVPPPVTVVAKEAPPEPPPVVVVKRNPDDPVPQTALQAQLTEALGNIPFRLIGNEKMSSDKLTQNNLLGLYGATERKGVYAIGVMDSNAVCMVGGGAARKSPAEVRAAMTSGQPDELMLNKAHEFLRSAAGILSESAGDPAITVSMAKASIVKNTFAKLAEVLHQTGHRSDFRISIPGYGEGRMAFFVMAL
jgi:CheY-like chemotaxis protein